MIAEGYLTCDIAKDLKTPVMAKPSDRTRLRRVTLSEYLQAWTVLDERERLAFDLVIFCGLRESEAYGLRNGDVIQDGAIRVERFLVPSDGQCDQNESDSNRRCRTRDLRAASGVDRDPA